MTARTDLARELTSLPPIRFGLSDFKTSVDQRMVILDKFAETVVQDSGAPATERMDVLAEISNCIHETLTSTIPLYRTDLDEDRRGDFRDSFELTCGYVDFLRDLIPDPILAKIPAPCLVRYIVGDTSIRANSLDLMWTAHKEFGRELGCDPTEEIKALEVQIENLYKLQGKIPIDEPKRMSLEISYLDIQIKSIKGRLLQENIQLDVVQLKALPLLHAASVLAYSGQKNRTTEDVESWLDCWKSIIPQALAEPDRRKILAATHLAFLNSASAVIEMDSRLAVEVLDLLYGLTYSAEPVQSVPTVHVILHSDKAFFLSREIEEVSCSLSKKMRTGLGAWASDPGNDKRAWSNSAVFVGDCLQLAKEGRRVFEGFPSEVILCPHGDLRFLPWTSILGRAGVDVKYPRSGAVQEPEVIQEKSDQGRGNPEGAVLIFDTIFDRKPRGKLFERIRAHADQIFPTNCDIVTFSSLRPLANDRANILGALERHKNIVLFCHAASDLWNIAKAGIILDYEENEVLSGDVLTQGLKGGDRQILLLACQTGSSSWFLPGTSLADLFSRAGAKVSIGSLWAMSSDSALALLRELSESSEDELSDKFEDCIHRSTDKKLIPFFQIS